MHGVYQMVVLIQIKPIAAVLFKYACHSSRHDRLMDDYCIMPSMVSAPLPIIIGGRNLKICQKFVGQNFWLHLWGDKSLWGSLSC